MIGGLRHHAAMIDNFDRAILAALQRNNRQPMAAIGAAVGLSEPAVRRRVGRLRRAGMIVADVSLVDPSALGIGIIMAVRFGTESRATYAAFSADIMACPHITQCYTVTGEADFIIIGHFADMAQFDAWVQSDILTRAYIARTTTNIVYRRVKFTTAIPV